MRSVHDAELDTSRRRFNALTADSEAAVALASTESETDAAKAAAYLNEHMDIQRSANSDARSAESSVRHAAQRGTMLQHMDKAEKRISVEEPLSPPCRNNGLFRAPQSQRMLRLDNSSFSRSRRTKSCRPTP